jgi:hypothetical protein
MKIKRIILSFVSSVLLLCILVSCGTVTGPTDNGKDDPPDDSGNAGGETLPPDEGGYEFSVRFEYNGAPFIPDEDVTVQWSNGQTVKRAEVDGSGVARISGLDGEYHVTLLEPLSEYTYDPSYCDADNDNRDLTIKLFKLSKPKKGTGANLYEKAFTINTTGYYRVKLTKAGQKLCFSFAATASGEYEFRSLMDVKANNVNPILYYYGNSSIGYVNETDVQIITGGGSGFTSNFKFIADIDNDNITEGGGMLVSFAIAADIKTGEYPAYVDFILEYKKDYEAGSLETEIVVPKELDRITSYAPGHEYDDGKYKLVNSYYTDPETKQNIFEDDRFAYNPETGFYHLYDLAKYSETNGFGPILYAHITTPTVFTPAAFTTIELAGNKALTVYKDGKLYNHKLFIEGIGPLLLDPTNGGTNPLATVGPYFCAPLCPCRTSGKCAGACTDSCTSCLDACRRCPEGGINSPGYAGYANSDGLCPVTDELQKFLEAFSISQSYFIDGGGWVETQADPPYHAGEDDQWLFACCYYEEK